MSKQYRILVTGSRDWINPDVVIDALHEQRLVAVFFGVTPVLIHGGARGLDLLAEFVWDAAYGGLIEEYPAENFETPLVRNQYMVDLGADVCLAFATKWASGTGHCARAARRAGIRVIDYGVNTQ